MKTKTYKEHNYYSIFHDGKTLRFYLDENKPMTELEIPEFYDVKITDKCFSNCEFCYQNSTTNGLEYKNIPEKIKHIFGNMRKKDRPYQVAIGGGEPTTHSEFEIILKTFYDLDIVPNYTTNGMHLTKDILKYTKKYCGGVAISCHPHLKEFWEKAIEEYSKSGIKLNLHLIISDKKSIDYFFDIYYRYRKNIDYFVLLPYTVCGRAKEKELEFDILFQRILELKDHSNIAYGAGFHPLLCKYTEIGADIFDPEMFSKYIDMRGNCTMYPSSFDLTPIKELYNEST